MTVDALDLDAVTAGLPAGYRARPFREEDREPLTEARNAELPEVERGTATEWRHWEATMPDETLERLVVEAADGALVAFLNVSNGGPFRAPDGSARGGVQVAATHRRKGIGSALLPVLETRARALGAPKIHSSVSARVEEALSWAEKRGYREIGRRIQAAIDLDAFEPARWEERTRRTRDGGIRFVTLNERRRALDETGFEDLLHVMYDVEAEAWEDVPIATPMPHWPYETFRRLTLEMPGTALDLSVLAYDGDRIVGLTSSYRNEGGKKGGTAFTGTLRAYRGRGIAFTLKVEALTRAKASGLRWMLTTNDEPNKPMRGINYTLGYVPLPANIQLEKSL